MKKLIAFVMIAVMLVSMLGVIAFANVSGDVISPEHGNTEIIEKPTSPKTGDALSVGGLALLSVVCGGVAVVSLRKLHG